MEIARFTEIDRYRNGVTAHKVLEVTGGNVKIMVKPMFQANGQLDAPFSDTTDIKPGQWLDFVFSYQTNSGHISSYSYRYLGHTPHQFIPEAVNQE